MSVENLKLWKLVEITPPTHIQGAKVSGQNRTTVKAIYQKEKATEVFGIQGVSWGVKVGSEEYIRVPVGDELLLQYTAVMFFNFEDSKGEIPIAAAIKEVSTFKRNTPQQYNSLDNEAIKKVRTDAMTKGLSELGFNADIFKGYYDIQGYSDYVSSVTNEAEQDKQELSKISEAEEYAKWKTIAIEEYSDLNTNTAIQTVFTRHVRKATAIGDTNSIKLFEDAKNKRIAEIKGSKQ